VDPRIPAEAKDSAVGRNDEPGTDMCSAVALVHENGEPDTMRSLSHRPSPVGFSRRMGVDYPLQRLVVRESDHWIAVHGLIRSQQDKREHRMRAIRCPSLRHEPPSGWYGSLRRRSFAELVESGGLHSLNRAEIQAMVDSLPTA
jgi:hypothetical protein